MANVFYSDPTGVLKSQLADDLACSGEQDLPSHRVVGAC